MDKFKYDRLIHVMAVHFIFGLFIGLTCAGLLLAFDFVGLRSLIWRADAATCDLILLLAGFAETFGGIVSATAIMILPYENESY
jgi:hypothetical protein